MRPAGFTLIELLVVISIISILSVVGFVNFKGFSQEKATDEAIGQIQTFLRLSQSNATSGTLCNSQKAESWSVKFLDDQKTMELRCNPDDYLQKSETLKDVLIESIYANRECPEGLDCPQSVCSSYPQAHTSVEFSPLSGAVSFKEDASTQSCLPSQKIVKIVVQNSKTNQQKTISVSKGGAIGVQ